ncbi:hypothetical protein HRbin33_01654 [bacterium HR33]|nr:hypothetical protein HRbin33_01654 [bacterium HR33]
MTERASDLGGALPGPCFTFSSTVHYDELDPMNMLHNTRYAVHVERAIIAFFGTFGRRWERDVRRNPDQFHVVKEFRIEFLTPISEVGSVDVKIWVERIGNSSCSFGFLMQSPGGEIEHARGVRTIVKLDPETLRPVPWTDKFRTYCAQILR